MKCPKCGSDKISSWSFDGLWARCDNCGFETDTENFEAEESKDDSN